MIVGGFFNPMNAVMTPVFKVFLDYLAEFATPEEILAFEFPSDQDRRLQSLLEANGESELSDEEKLELDQMIYFNDVLTLMKVRAQATLKKIYERHVGGIIPLRELIRIFG